MHGQECQWVAWLHKSVRINKKAEWSIFAQIHPSRKILEKFSNLFLQILSTYTGEKLRDLCKCSEIFLNG